MKDEAIEGMAKDKLKTDDFKADDELEFDDFNFDMEQTAPKDDRSPATKVAGSFVEGIKETVVSPSFIENTVKAALPKEYGQAYDMADKVLTSAKDEITKGLKTVQPAAKSFFASAAKSVPKDHFLHEKLSSIEKWLGEYDEYKSEKTDTKKVREDSINLALGEVFKTQIEQTAKQSAADNLDRGIEAQRYKNTTKISSSMEKGISSLVQYQNSVNVNYQRKSLELQLRSYFLQTDMLEHMRKAHIESIAEFKLISKNTGLPEFVKINQAESFKQMARNKFMESLTGGLFKSSNEMVEGFAKNLRTAITQKASSLANIFSQGAMGLDMVGSMQMDDDYNFDGSPKEKESFNQKIGNTVGKMGGGLLAEAAAARAGKKTREFLDRNKTIGKYSRELGMMMEDMPARVQEFKKSNKGEFGYDQGMAKDAWSSIVRFGKSLIPGAQADMSIAGTNITDLNKASFTPEQTNKSINEIIPGYLSRILREIQVFRTGDGSIKLTEYDFNNNTFLGQDAVIANIKESIVPTSAKKDVDYKLDKLVGFIDEDKTLSDEDKNALKKTLFKSSANMDTSKVERFKEQDTFKQAGLTPEQAAVFAKLFAERFADTGDVIEDKNREANFASSFVGLRDSIKDTRKNVQEYANAGQMELLKEAGLVKKDSSGNTTIDFEKLLDEYIKPTTVTSDYYKKENIRPVSGNDSLRMVNSMPITKWDYKAGFGGNAKDVAGPMAQAVDNATDGQASDGKTVNLTALNGYNMSAIQELDKRQKTILEYLSAAKDNIKAFFTPKDKEDPVLKTLQESRDIQKEILEKIAAGGGTGGGFGIDLSQFTKKPQGIAENLAAVFTGVGSLLGSGISAGASVVGKAAGALSGKAKSFKDWMASPSPMIDSIKGKIGEKIDASYNKLKQYGDVFVAGEKDPRIVFNKLKEGKYYKMLENGSKVAISKVEDITDDIYDEMGNLVLKKDEIKNTFTNMVDSGKGKIAKLASVVGSKISKGKDYIKGLIPPALTSMKAAFDRVSGKIKELMDYPADVYVKGETTPRLTAFVMNNGGYFSSVSKKPILRPSQIDGPVSDIEGNILITSEDIQKGLVDKFGNDFTFPLLRFAKTGLAVGMKLANASLNLGKNLLSKAKDKLKNINLPNINFGFDGIMGESGKQTVDLLTEIRDMLKIRFGFEYEFMGPRKPLPSVSSTTSEDKDQSDDTPNAAAAAAPSTRPNSIDSVVSGVGSVIGMGKGLLSKIPKIGGLFTDKKQETTDNLKDQANQLKDSAQDKIKSAQESAKEATKSAKEKIEEVTQSSKEAIEKAKESAQTVGGKVKKAFNDTDGDGKRQGSWRDMKMGNKKNAEFEKAKAELPEYENTFDLIARKLSGIKDTIGSVVGGIGGLLGGKDGGGAGDLIDAAGDLVGNKKPGTTVPGAKKPGLLRRGLGLAGRGLGLAGRAARATYNSPVGKGLKWAAGKGSFGMIKGAARMVPIALRGMGAVGGLVARGGLMAGGAALGAAGSVAGGVLGSVLGGAAALMGSPVVLGATAAYGAYKLYKYLTRNSISDLGKLRYIQYGFDKDDTSHVNKVLGLESFLEENATSFQKGGQATITKVKPEQAKDMFALFDVDMEDKEQVEKFQTWFQYRFKPIYLQHQTAVFQADKNSKLSKVDNLEPKAKLQYFKAVKLENGPYDIEVSPIADLEYLPSGKQQANAYYEGYLAKLEKEAKDKTDTTAEASLKSTQTNAATDANAKAKSADGSALDKDGKPVQKKGMLAQLWDDTKSLTKETVAKSSNAIGKGFGNNVSNLDSIRFRLYGLVDMDRLKVISLRTMEEKLLNRIKFEGTGAASLSMDANEALEMFKLDFGISSKVDKRATDWKDWFTNRFLKIYLEYAGAMKSTLGKASVDDFGLKNTQALEIATRLMGSGSWSVTSSPWSDYALNTQSASIDGFLTLIKGKAQNDKMVEEKKEKAKDQLQQSREGKLNDSTKDNQAKALASPKPSGALPGNDPMYTPKNPTTDERSKGPTFAAPGSASGNVGGNTPTGTGEKLDKIPAPNGAGFQAVAPTIKEAAKATGVKEDTMLAVAAVESGFNPGATPKGAGMSSSAKGLYQFLDGTWRGITQQKGSKYDITPSTSPFDARANALMGGEFIKQNTNTLKSVVPEVGPTEAYMAHFLGPGGAKQFFSMDKNEAAATRMPKAAAANVPIFYDRGRPRSAGEVYSLMSNKLSKVSRAYGLKLDIDGQMETKGGATSTPTQEQKTAASPEYTPMKSGGASYGSNKATNTAGTAANPIKIEQRKPNTDIYKAKPAESSSAVASETITPRSKYTPEQLSDMQNQPKDITPSTDTPINPNSSLFKPREVVQQAAKAAAPVEEKPLTKAAINPALNFGPIETKTEYLGKTDEYKKWAKEQGASEAVINDSTPITSIQTQPIPTQAAVQASAPIPTQVRYQKAPYNSPTYNTQKQTPDVFGIGGILKSASDAIAPSGRVGAYNTPNAPTYSRATPGYSNSKNPFTALGALINTPAPAQRGYSSPVPMANPSVAGSTYSPAPTAITPPITATPSVVPTVTPTPVVNQQPSIVASAKPNLIAKDTSSINVNQDKEYLSSLVSIDSTLTKSLDVQKEILKAIMTLSNKDSSAAAKTVETTSETKAAEAAPIVRQSKEVPKFPVSMSRTTYA